MWAPFLPLDITKTDSHLCHVCHPYSDSHAATGTGWSHVGFKARPSCSKMMKTRFFLAAPIKRCWENPHPWVFYDLNLTSTLSLLIHFARGVAFKKMKIRLAQKMQRSQSLLVLDGQSLVTGSLPFKLRALRSTFLYNIQSLEYFHRSTFSPFSLFWLEHLHPFQNYSSYWETLLPWFSLQDKLYTNRKSILLIDHGVVPRRSQDRHQWTLTSTSRICSVPGGCTHHWDVRNVKFMHGELQR